MNARVSIIVGSTSDMPVMEASCKFLDSNEIPFEVLALSEHRTPDEVAEYAKNAHKRDVEVFIAAAGAPALSEKVNLYKQILKQKIVKANADLADVCYKF